MSNVIVTQSLVIYSTVSHLRDSEETSVKVLAFGHYIPRVKTHEVYWKNEKSHERVLVLGCDLLESYSKK